MLRIYQGTDEYHEKVQSVKEFINFHHLPKSLANRLQESFQHSWSYTNGIDMNTVRFGPLPPLPIKLGLVATKPVFGFPTRWDSNQPAQVQGLAKNWNFACSKLWYGTYQKTNNKGADQTARMHRLVCAFDVRKLTKTGFLASRPKYDSNLGNLKAHMLL